MDPYSEALQQQHRDKPPRLVLQDDTAQARYGLARFLSEGEEPELDIRVSFEMIGMAVMPIVLLGPPAIADRGQQGTEQAKHLGLPGGLKYLPVSGVMPEESHLGEHTREKRGIQELEPEQLRRQQETKGKSETTQRLQDFPGVIAWLPVE
jgi:hypothetical protein